MKGVADLAAIPSAARIFSVTEFIIVLLCKIKDSTFFNRQLGFLGDLGSLLFDTLQPVNVHPEKRNRVRLVELWIPKGSVHSRFDSFV